MAAGPGDLTKGRDKDKEAARTAEGAAGFSWAEEVTRVKKIWGAPSANEPLAPVRRSPRTQPRAVLRARD